MRIKRNLRRSHINLSHTELSALEKLVEIAMDRLEEAPADVLSIGERRAIGHWRGNPLREATQPDGELSE